jgi:glycosyltransferase involved in cell wall biosynthesis
MTAGIPARGTTNSNAIGTVLRPIELQPIGPAPVVSVLISNYNYGRFLEQAIRSALEQTYSNLQVIVCDDGSTDESLQIADALATEDDRVKVLRKENGGQASAFNAGFTLCTGEIVCFLDADDIFNSEKVERCVDAFASTNAGLLVHQMMIVDENGRNLQRIPTFTRFEQGWIGERVIERGGRWRWGPTSAVAIRRQIGSRVFPMPELGFRTDADTFVLMLAPLLTPICGLEEILAFYRLHGSNAFGQRKLDSRAVERTRRALTISIDAVNNRLAEMEWTSVRLDANNNLKLQEQRFLAAALEGKEPRRQLFHQYWKLMRAVKNDDLYDGAQKGWAIVLFGICLIIPKNLRPSWLSLSLGTSRAKELVRRIREREWHRGGAR